MKTNQSTTKLAIIAMATLLLGAVGCENYQEDHYYTKGHLLRAPSQEAHEEAPTATKESSSTTTSQGEMTSSASSDSPAVAPVDSEDVAPEAPFRVETVRSVRNHTIVPIEEPATSGPAVVVRQPSPSGTTPKKLGPVAKASDVQDVDPEWQPKPEAPKAIESISFTNPTWKRFSMENPEVSVPGMGNEGSVSCEMKCAPGQGVIGIIVDLPFGGHATEEKTFLICASLSSSGGILEATQTNSCHGVGVDPDGINGVTYSVSNDGSKVYAKIPFTQYLNTPDPSDQNVLAKMFPTFPKKSSMNIARGIKGGILGNNIECTRLMSATVKVTDKEPITEGDEEECSVFAEGPIWHSKSQTYSYPRAEAENPSGTPYKIECDTGHLMTGLRMAGKANGGTNQKPLLEIECSKLAVEMKD